MATPRPALGDRGEDGAHGGQVADVAGERVAARQFARGGSEPDGIATEQRERGAECREARRDRTADAAATSGDHGVHADKGLRGRHPFASGRSPAVCAERARLRSSWALPGRYCTGHGTAA